GLTAARGGDVEPLGVDRLPGDDDMGRRLPLGLVGRDGVAVRIRSKARGNLKRFVLAGEGAGDLALGPDLFDGGQFSGRESMLAIIPLENDRITRRDFDRAPGAK